MPILNAYTPVGQLVSDHVSRALVFERLGIDFCCGGKMPLAQVCAERGLDVNRVLRELEASDALETETERVDWSSATMTELVDHIVTKHHAYLRAELPRLETLSQKVAQVHGKQHPELLELNDTFCNLKSELDNHMLKEERVLFPYIKCLETGVPDGNFHCGSISTPITVMIYEHEAVGANLERMRALTNGYQAPADACTSYQALLAGLGDLEADLHQHVHKENNILFPKAILAEAASYAEIL